MGNVILPQDITTKDTVNHKGYGKQSHPNRKLSHPPSWPADKNTLFSLTREPSRTAPQHPYNQPAQTSPSTPAQTHQKKPERRAKSDHNNRKNNTHQKIPHTLSHPKEGAP